MTAGSSAKSYSLFAVILILGCFVAVFVIMTSYWPDYTLAKDRRTNIQADNVRLKNALNSSKNFLAAFQDQNQNVSLLKLSLPRENIDMPNFISSISQLALQSGVVLTNFQVSSSEPLNAPPYSIQRADLGVSVTGTYLSFKDFMTRMENHLRIIDVHHVVLSASGSEGEGTLPLQYQVQMRTYYQQ